MGTPKGHYVGHLAPQGVALGHQRDHIWHHGGAMVATWSQEPSLEGPKNSEIDDCYTVLKGVAAEGHAPWKGPKQSN